MRLNLQAPVDTGNRRGFQGFDSHDVSLQSEVREPIKT